MKHQRKLTRFGSALLTITLITAFPHGVLATTKYKILHRFTGSPDGSQPYAAPIFDQVGNLYGTSWSGGNSTCPNGGCGRVFELTTNAAGTWKEKVLHNFTGSDGDGPFAGLTFDLAGNLYGTTQAGGNLAGCNGYGCGVVFRLTPHRDGSWTESVLHAFTGGNDGADPFAGLIFDAAGNLYGTTAYGGADGFGTVFELSTNADGTWKEKVLHHFTGGADGACPVAGLIFDRAGNLYGTTYEGGVTTSCHGGGCGVVFEMTPNANGSWKEEVIHRFLGSDGSAPHSGLIFDDAGNLFGTTQLGGGNFAVCDTYGCGLVFELTPNAHHGWKEKVLHTFTGGADGNQPVGGLIFDQAGSLYGTTIAGGANNFGAVFQLIPEANGRWTQKVLRSFKSGTDGSQPWAGLIFGPGDNLYGTTFAGANNGGCHNYGCGTVFKLVPR